MLIKSMTRFNPNKLLKREMIWLMQHRCRHGATYMEHPSCYFKEQPDDGPVMEKIGFLDIETSNLNADFGYIFSYCIKELDGPIYEYVIKPGEIRAFTFDKNLMKQFYKDVMQFDRLVVYWGKDRRHDIPFLRQRAIKWGVPFPLYREVFVNDLYDIVKAKLKLHRSGLANACEFFDIPCKQHRLDPNRWQKAMAGSQEALDHILKHNEEDCVSTEQLWKLLRDYSRNPNTTI